VAPSSTTLSVAPVEYPRITDKGDIYMQRFKDGTWAFDDTGVMHKGAQVGRLSGWVVVEDGDISEVWAEDATGRLTLLASGSWFTNALTAALREDLPEYIEYQASSKRHWREAAAFQNAKAMS
jgi:hypothetical protein